MRAEPAPRAGDGRFERRRCLEQIPGELIRFRFKEAFALAERALDLKPDAEDMEALMSPQRGTDSRDFDPPTMYEILAALRRDGGNGPWHAQLRFCLLERLHRGPEAFAQAEKLCGLAKRYGWMRFHRGDMLFRTYCSYDQAQKDYRAAFAVAPSFWKAGALAAEAALCGGDAAGAFKRMDALVGSVEERSDKLALQSWRGEMRLWRGEYALALADLEEPVEAGSQLSRCWRGAAFLALGETDRALADLDAYLSRAPDDIEALIWRGEALRRSGSAASAANDLDRILEMCPNHIFALVNRALLDAAAGDREVLWGRVRTLPPEILGYFQWKRRAALVKDSPLSDFTGLLEEILTVAGGIRRTEFYLFPLWLGDRP